MDFQPHNLIATIQNLSNAVCWHAAWSIDERSDSVRVTRWMIVTEFHSRAIGAKMGAVFMKTADRPSKACIPTVAF